MRQALQKTLIVIFNERGNLIDNVTNKISEGTARHDKKALGLKRQLKTNTELKDKIENLAEEVGQEWLLERPLMPVELLMEPWDEAFPTHWWEPRAKEGDAIKFDSAAETQNIHIRTDNASSTGDSWLYAIALFEPLWKYWQVLIWTTSEENQTADDNDKPGKDYAACMSLGKQGESFEEGDMATTVRRFSQASRNVLNRANAKTKEVRNSSALTTLGMPSISAIKGVATILCPEEVDRAKHQMSNQMGGGTLKPSFKQKIRFPELGRPRLPAAIPKIE